jgi:hypothetical protein
MADLRAGYPRLPRAANTVVDGQDKSCPATQASGVTRNGPEFDHQRLPLGVGLVRLTCGPDSIFGPDASWHARGHIQGDDSAGFIVSGEITQQGGLHAVGEASVLGISDGLQPVQAVGICGAL